MDNSNHNVGHIGAKYAIDPVFVHLTPLLDDEKAWTARKDSVWKKKSV